MTAKCSCGKELCTSRIALFSNLPMDIQQQLVLSSVHTERTRGDFLIDEGEIITTIRIIRKGRVKINHYDREGKEYILNILTDGDIIGEELFFESAKSDYNAICITEVKLCEINVQDLLNLISREPSAAWNMIRYLSAKLHQSNNLLEILHENDAEARIARFLLERSERIHDTEIGLTIDDIAASINLRKETVSRKLTELQNNNYIKRMGQKRIKLINPENLKNLI